MLANEVLLVGCAPLTIVHALQLLGDGKCTHSHLQLSLAEADPASVLAPIVGGGDQKAAGNTPLTKSSASATHPSFPRNLICPINFARGPVSPCSKPLAPIHETLRDRIYSKTAGANSSLANLAIGVPSPVGPDNPAEIAPPLALIGLHAVPRLPSRRSAHTRSPRGCGRRERGHLTACATGRRTEACRLCRCGCCW